MSRNDKRPPAQSNRTAKVAGTGGSQKMSKSVKAALSFADDPCPFYGLNTQGQS
ncbi:7344_t:CDS:2 [Paraglomus occultum]|uniref:7344_t:CDS:1 n=1 Tax=Paraglomus occultum TaxID=144539 RepID=A0A9N9G9M3_9GLOM|nr:7344_t:CDS:2 [Paraglomus occultum]